MTPSLDLLSALFDCFREKFLHLLVFFLALALNRQIWTLDLFVWSPTSYSFGYADIDSSAFKSVNVTGGFETGTPFSLSDTLPFCHIAVYIELSLFPQLQSLHRPASEALVSASRGPGSIPSLSATHSARGVTATLPDKEGVTSRAVDLDSGTWSESAIFVGLGADFDRVHRVRHSREYNLVILWGNGSRARIIRLSFVFLKPASSVINE
jgi:hypothetical protein